MAYVGTTNTLIANGGSADYLFVIKQALIAAGWQLLACSNGTVLNTGTPATDNLTTAAAFNGANAWCQLQEPAGPTNRRQFILMHGAAGSVNALIKYSRATGFTGGNATTCGTTGGGDGRVIVAGGTAITPTYTDATATQATVQGGVICGSSGYVQAVASNTLTGGTSGTFGWWAFQYPVGGNVIGNAFLFHEPIAAGSTPSQDADLSARYFQETNTTASYPTIIGSYNNNYSTAGSGPPNYWRGWSFWEAYGLAGAAYRYYQAANNQFTYNQTPSNANVSWPYNSGSLSPYDGKVTMTPVLIGGYGGPVSAPVRYLFKGYSTTVLTFSTTQNFLDTFNLSSADPRVAVQIAYAAGSAPGNCAIPWVTSVVPLV